MRLILTAFSFLLAATASAQEVGGSFDLGGKTTSDLKFDMVAVSDVDGKNDCSAYGEGAIGMDDKGLILSCQSGSWVSMKLTGNGEYITGVITPSYNSRGSKFIADTTWFCALTGLKAVGDAENATLVLKQNGWYMNYQRGGWPIVINWGCIK